MKRFPLLILFLYISILTLCAQKEIRGLVFTPEGESLPGVMIKLFEGKKLQGYGRSNNEGDFKIKVSDESPDTLLLVADCIGYEQLQIKVSNSATTLRLTMQQKTTTLKEVTVKAPNIRQRGDTMRFRLSAFTGRSDQSLEEGLKRLPGVEVSEGGQVSYQGKEISDFYVENQQLVGANYGLVTKNMPVDYVTDVEFIENHQAAAMDKGRMSDKVALNVKLSNKAKFKPVGKADVLAGAQKNRFIYRVGATGMLFTHKFQTMMTLKAGNYGKDASIFIDQFNGLNNYAERALGNLTGAKPPLAKDVYAIGNDINGSVNFLRAFNSVKTLRINLLYDYQQSRNFYSQKSIYEIDNEKIEFYESGDPHSMSHLPYLNVRYNLNDTNKYVNNDFMAKMEIRNNDFNLVSDNSYFFQKQHIRALIISDNFSWRTKIKNKSLSFSTNLSYLISPVSTLKVNSPDNFEAYQSASGHTLKWMANTSFDWKKGYSIWYLPISADFSSSHLYTNLEWEKVFKNKISSTEANIYLSPKYEYTPQNRKIEVLLSVPLNLQLFHATNSYSKAKADIDRILINPLFRVNYRPNSRILFTINGSLSHSTGDILDLLTNEIMTDFRTVKTSSGIIGKVKNLNFGVKVAYNNPVNMVFADASANYSNSKRNTVNSLYISNEEIEQGVLFLDNSSNIFSTSAMISKSFNDIGLNLTLRGNYSWSKNHTFQQDRLITSFSSFYSLSPRIIINPIKFFEIRYNAIISKNFTKFYDSRTGIFSMNNDLHLSIYPAEGWDLFGETSILRKELSDGSYKDFSLFNVGATWKFKKYRLTLRADNLLNTRHYTYSIFNGINIYNYDFALNGTTVYLKFTMTF